MNLHSLSVYNRLPEDSTSAPDFIFLDNDFSALDSNQPPDILYREFISILMGKVIEETVSEKNISDVVTFYSFFYHNFSHKYINNESLKELFFGEFYTINEYFISCYRNLLKHQRGGCKSVNATKKTLCQLINYCFQNVLSLYQNKKPDENLFCSAKSIALPLMLKPWDALYRTDSSRLYLVDSDSGRNFKIYNDQFAIEQTFSVDQPTKLTSIQQRIYISSTYAAKLYLYEPSVNNLATIAVPEPIEIVYGKGEDIFLIGRSKKHYRLTGTNCQAVGDCAIPADFYVDNYCFYQDKVLCTSHTDNRICEWSIGSDQVRYIVLPGLYMPNSIEVSEGLIYIAEKETGHLNVYDLVSFEAICSSGFFSKQGLGNADTTKLLPVKRRGQPPHLYVFSWLKHTIVDYELAIF